MDHSQSRFYVLEILLNDILSLIKPLEDDHHQRQYTLYQIKNVVQSIASLKDVVIRPFGSFASNLYTKWGDLDASLELSHVAPNPTVRKRKQGLLRDLMRALRKYGIASSFTFVPQARVPVLKFQTNLHNISCDVSVDNHTGWMKSRVLMQISEIDERFRDVVLLTKEWAKAQNINDPKNGTLNSYSLCLLVIFHFQTCSPAILPPLRDIYDGNFVDATGPWSSIEMRIEAACAANIARFKTLRQRNHSTLCELLTSFFDKFSKMERISSHTVISTYTGQWQNMRNNPRWMDKSHSLLVEDPFERPDNAARAVSINGLGTISNAFIRTFLDLSSNRVLSDRNLMLDVLLRSNINSQLKVTPPNPYSASKSHVRSYAQRNGYTASTADLNRHQNNQNSKTSGAVASTYYDAARNQKQTPAYVSGYIEVGEDYYRARNSNVLTNTVQTSPAANRSPTSDNTQTDYFCGISGYIARGPDYNVIPDSVRTSPAANRSATSKNTQTGYSSGYIAGGPDYRSRNNSVAPNSVQTSDAANRSATSNSGQAGYFSGYIAGGINPIGAADDTRSQASSSRTSQVYGKKPNYSHAAAQEWQTRKPKNFIA